MKRFKGRKRFWRSWPVILLVVLILLGAGYIATREWYTHNLGAVSSSQKTVYFTVASGSSVDEIGGGLEKAHLIRSAKAFDTYVRGKQLFDQLQAGTYRLSPSLSVPQIVDKMINGDVAKNLLTILPGKTIDQIRRVFKQAGYGDDELSVAFNASTYADEPVLAGLPPGASLEGYLYPDSFQKESDTPAQTIIKESLDEMQTHLTPDILSGFSAHGLSPFQGVTLASIVYQESGDPAAEPTIAQVFLSRIAQGMPLQSNVTANYAADAAGVPRTINIDSPYNTYLYPGLTPGPIGNMTDAALKAVAHPSKTDYLYFVAGDDGTIHFSHTGAEHQAAVQKYCTKKC